MIPKIRFSGAREMTNKVLKIAELFPGRIGQALYLEAQVEMTEAKRRTPVDITPNAPHPGQLRNSGMVGQPQREGKRIFVELTFGGAAKDYAVYVHEILDNFHPVGQAKYLESVINESKPYMLARVARRLQL